MLHSDSSSYRRLTDLPPELYYDILELIPKHELQRTTAALLLVIPRSPVPRHCLFRYVRLTYPGQIIRLYQKLRREKEFIPLIESFILETWTVDADSVVNLMQLLVSLGRTKEVRMFVGPNFTPEHLEDIFKTPWLNLQLLSLRFRPYVQRATYYQFLAGVYFDSTLLALSQWPGGNGLVPRLSVIQDPLDPSIAPTGKFAQPIVFFGLDPIKRLAISQLSYEVKYLRLRIPARQLSQFLYTVPNSFPALHFLDLSTSHVTESDVDAILGRFGMLKHLVLDGCSVISQRADLEEEERRSLWARLGKNMALAGMKLAREREKKLREWYQQYALQSAMQEMMIQHGAQPVEPRYRAPRRPHKGRKGLATATISLRDSPSQSTNSQPQPSPPPGVIPTRKFRILPPQPQPLTVSLTAPEYRKSSNSDIRAVHDSTRVEFERGWAEGLAVLASRRRQFLQSWRNDIQIFMFRHHSNNILKDGDSGLGTKDDLGLQGLVEVKSAEDFAVKEDQCPILCLAGTGRKDIEGHHGRCGHSVAWDVWEDDL